MRLITFHIAILCFLFAGCLSHISLQGETYEGRRSQDRSEVSDSLKPLSNTKVVVRHSKDQAPLWSYFGFILLSDSLGNIHNDFKATGSRGVAIAEKDGFISDTVYFTYRDGDTVKVKFYLNSIKK